MPGPTQAAISTGVKPRANGLRIDRRVAGWRVNKAPVSSHLCRDGVCSGQRTQIDSTLVVGFCHFLAAYFWPPRTRPVFIGVRRQF
jgi:hypothetical protein